MVEFIGMLKVKVVKGTNLAVRDMLSSDPYVILTLGQQVCSFFSFLHPLNYVANTHTIDIFLLEIGNALLFMQIMTWQ